MSNAKMLSTALAVGKALQSEMKPLTVNGTVYDGTQPVELRVGPLPVVAAVKDMTDPAGQYVLEETGTVWVYRFRQGCTNWLPLAYTSPADHTPCGGVGYRFPLRVSGSTGEESEHSTTFLTGYIPIMPGDTVRFRNIVMNSAAYGCIAPYYNASGAILSNQHAGYPESTGGNIILEDNGDYSIRIPTDSAHSTARFIRIQGYYKQGVTPEIGTGIITVNEEISEAENGWAWVDTGMAYGYDTASLTALEGRTARLEAAEEDAQKRLTDLERGSGDTLPYWWEEYLPGRIAAIRAHRDEGGREAFSFAVITDLHESANLGKRTGAVAKRVMDACGIGYAVDLGDFATQSCVETKAEMEASMDRAGVILAPIAHRLLRTEGNHDGAWGIDGAGGTYCHRFTEAEQYNRIFRTVAEGMHPTFDRDGVGYYLDDGVNRARLVVLNSHHTRGQANAFSHHRFGQSQFDLAVQALTTVPGEDWVVLFFSHTPPVEAVDYDGDGVCETPLAGNLPEQALLRDLIRGYMERNASFSGSYGSEGSWERVTLEGVDFSSAKGHFAAYFAGHIHGDAVFGADGTYPFPIITVRSDAPREKFASEQAEPREAGTCTEQSFEVVTLVRTASGLTLYLDKIGAGKDRAVQVSLTG